MTWHRRLLLPQQPWRTSEDPGLRTNQFLGAEMTLSAGNGKEMTKLESGHASSSSSSSSSSSAAATARNDMGKPRRFTWTGPAIVLGFELLESIAFSGVALNLVVYLGTVLHGSTAFNAAHVDTWNGTTFIVPVIGAFLADSCWGKYNTIVASLLFYLAVSVLLLIVIPSSAGGVLNFEIDGTEMPQLMDAGPGAAHLVGGDLAAPAAVVRGDLVSPGVQEALRRLLRGAVPHLHRHGGRQVSAAPVRGGAVRRGRRPRGGKEEAVLLHLVLRRHQPRHLRRRDARLLAAAERVLGARIRGLRALPAPGGGRLPRRHALVQGAAPRGEPAQGHPQSHGGVRQEEEDQAATSCGSRRRRPAARAGGRRRPAEAGAHQGTEVPGQGGREGQRRQQGRSLGSVHGERGGGRQDPGAHGPHLADLRAVRGVPGADDHHIHPAGDGHGQQGVREGEGAGGVHGVGGGGVHAAVGAAARHRHHAARQEMGASRERRPHPAAADGRGAVPGGPGDGDGGAGGEAAAAQRQRGQDDGHRVAGAAVRAGGRVRRLLRDRAAGVLLRGGAGVDAQHLLRLLLPRALAGVLRQHGGGDGRVAVEARVADAGPQRGAPRLLLLAVDGHRRRQPADLLAARRPVHDQASPHPFGVVVVVELIS